MHYLCKTNPAVTQRPLCYHRDTSETANIVRPMKIVLFDTEESYENLLPLSYTRPVSAFRVGIVTIREKWEHFLPGEYSYYPKNYLREKFPLDCPEDEEAIFIAGNKLPDKATALEAWQLRRGEALRDSGGIWAYRGLRRDFEHLQPGFGRESANDSRRIQYVFDVFGMNAEEIVNDFVWYTSLTARASHLTLDPYPRQCEVAERNAGIVYREGCHS